VLTEPRVAPAALNRVIGPVPAGVPTYQGLADAVRRAVLDGSLPLGTRVPSERELAAALGISRTTTAAAYQRLREQGVLRTRRGSGSVTALPGGTERTAALLVPDSDDGGPVDLAVAAPAALPGLAEAAHRAVDQLARRTDAGGYAHLGLPELRARLAERYTARGVPTGPEQILVTNGAQAATSLLMSVLIGPGDRVAVENPAYPHALAAIRASGARPVAVPVREDGLDLEMLEAALRQAAPRAVHLTPDHHNPTGTSLDAAARARLRALATRYRTPVIGDETLSDLTLDGSPPPPILGASPDEYLIAIGSASKTFWGGLRIGWIRAPRDVVLRLGQARVHRDLSTAMLDQLVVLELLADDASLVAQRCALLRDQRDTLVRAVHDALPWQVSVPAGGLSLWADLGAPLSSALAAVAPRYGVRVAPGSAFGVDGGFDQRLRLPFAATPGQLERGVAGLAAAWAGLATAGATAPAPSVPI
jgi:DNA-binding transcriptional MocR family regulator